MKTLFKYLKPYGIRISAGILIKVIGTLLDLGLPWVLAYIIDEVIPYKKISMILWWGVVMIVFSIGARTFNIVANRMAASVARDTTRHLRYDLFNKILSLSGSQLDYFTVSSLESRMTSDTYNIHNMIGITQRMGVRAPIIIIGGIIITLTMEPILSLILIGILPILFFVVYFVSKKGIPLYMKLQSSVDQMVRIVRENISGIRVIKALSKSDYEKRNFIDINEEIVNKEIKAGTTMAITNPIMNLLLNMGLTLVVVIGAFRVNSGVSETGKIVAFLSYFAIMLQAVMMVTRIFVIISKATSSAGRIEEVLQVEEDLKVGTEHKCKKNENTNENTDEQSDFIEFDHVSFSYTEEPCIIDMNFKIKRGGSLGIIGSTGAGKTTLINLLMRFYDVSEGTIKIGGRDIRTFNKQRLRKRFGVVFQNDVLFADNIFENISIGRGLSAERIYESTEHAQAATFIDELDETLDFRLTIRGSNLSGGQKQRLLIARALAGKPEILILDDTSSALDFKTDALLRKALRENYQKATTIVIAQRISSVMKLDNILVMEDGQMVAYGGHHELLKNCEVYQEIYQSQLYS